MHHEDLRALLNKRPFEAFRFYLMDGVTHYDVRHPEQCMVTRRMVVVGLPGENGDDVPDRAIFIGIIHIARVEPLSRASESQAG